MQTHRRRTRSASSFGIALAVAWLAACAPDRPPRDSPELVAAFRGDTLLVLAQSVRDSVAGGRPGSVAYIERFVVSVEDCNWLPPDRDRNQRLVRLKIEILR